VAVLWDSLSGYVHACLRALTDAGAEVLVVHRSPQPDAPFDETAVTAGLRTVAWTDTPEPAMVAGALDDFGPDAMVVCGWHIGPYRRVARRWRGRTLRLLTLPNQWWGTPRQRVGAALSRWLIRPSYDATFVTDQRAAELARRLGFGPARLVWGVNSCDQPRFAEVAQARSDELPPPAFLFVGRLVPDKAIDVLAEGYARYRAQVVEPWPLLVAGEGPQRSLLDGAEGVKMAGFVQPEHLPGLFGEAGCVVLPSRFEPWGVVIHEATSAGLPVVCTTVCGASTRLVLDGYNGGVVAPDDPGDLCRALLRVHHASDDERRAMGRASESLSRQYTPDRWARNLLARVAEMRVDLGLDTARREGG
jgi:glycosyltransferase involved in cell wall biosynthesis